MIGEDPRVDNAFARLWAVYDSGEAINATVARYTEIIMRHASPGDAYLLRGFVEALMEPREPVEAPTLAHEITMGRGVPSHVMARVLANQGPEAAKALEERARFAITSWDHGDTPARRVIESIAASVGGCIPMDPAILRVAIRVLRAVPSHQPLDRLDLQTMIELASYVRQEEAAA